MTGVIFPPQVALLCICAPQHRPWVIASHRSMGCSAGFAIRSKLGSACDGDHGWRTLEAHPGNRRHNEMASTTPPDHASFLSKFADSRICM